MESISHAAAQSRPRGLIVAASSTGQSGASVPVETAEHPATAQDAQPPAADMFALVGHEIRSPLASIQASAELLLRTDLTPEQQTLVAGMVQSSATLRTLISSALATARAEANGVELEREDFAPADTAQELVKLYRPIAEAENLELDLHVDADTKRSYLGAKPALIQALSNLIDNAVKYAGRTSCADEIGRIVIRMSITGARRRNDEDTRLCVEVSDSGNSLTPDKVEEIFQRFVRADSSVARTGFGLGLWITRRMLRQAGGDISVALNPPAGATFTFTLPVQRAAVPKLVASNDDPIIQEPGGVMNHRISDQKILIVDDHAINRSLISAMLGAFGAEFEPAETGEAAIELCREKHFDIVLMDLQMPGMTGDEAAAIIRKTGLNTKAKIAALTADFDQGRAFAASGVFDCAIEKPVTVQELHARLSDLLDSA